MGTGWRSVLYLEVRRILTVSSFNNVRAVKCIVVIKQNLTSNSSVTVVNIKVDRCMNHGIKFMFVYKS